ncbi:prisilkin-39-like [Bombyx mandarina]|uniref:Prisilkin-39-like n=1 Tax=Bombyx mandarina TaxID=7092 RepID=A0A6J2KH62_BOMMA|nr:prisilkin-39-like [Bombyx mandarina]
MNLKIPIIFLFGCTFAALKTEAALHENLLADETNTFEETDDLKTAANAWYIYSNFDRNYPDGSSNVYRHGFVTGFENYPSGNNYGRYSGYSSNVGNGGYGGYSGNGGLASYYGYKNPYYEAANHLGYGYYKKPGYGNIYNNGITPSLVTGYRGYS